MGRDPAHRLMRRQDAPAWLEWPAEVQALRGAKQLDGDDVIRQVERVLQLDRRRRAHADEVLHPSGGRDGVNTRRVRQHFDLVDQRGGGVLRDHVPRSDAWVWRHEERYRIWTCVPVMWPDEVIR